MAHLEDLERLPPAQPGEDQDALLQAPGRAGRGAHLRAPSGGVAYSGGLAESVHLSWTASNRSRGGCGMNVSGAGVMPSKIRFVQQSPPPAP